MPSEGNNLDVAQLRDLLGPDVVLLGWPSGSKGTPKKWGHLTAAHMTPSYLRKLDCGNIGVALGRVSGGLIALDVDDDAMVQPFIAVNPFLKDTLQTHGARGCVFWLKIRGDYPTKTTKLKTHAGEDCGEFRCGTNSQSIIHGIHPSGTRYAVANMAKPVVVDFASITWPTRIANPPKLEPQLLANDTERQSDRVTEPHSNRVTDVTEAMCGGGFFLIDDAVQLALPNKVHQNNNRLFVLARAVKTLEIQSGKFTPAQLRDVFNRWHKLAAEFLRPEQTHDDYMTEFMNAYASAKIPLGDGVITQAWKSANEKPLPAEAVEAFQDDRLRRVVALCRELQIIAGKEPFYLSARTLQTLLKQEGHATAARWLRSLCVLQILDEVEKGNGNRASRYRYKGKI